MKKFYLLLFCLLIAGTSFAQKTKFGLKLGANFANQHATYQNLSVNGSTLTSFYLGGFATAPLGQNFYFQPELLLSSQGSQYSERNYTEKYNTLNLNIPLMFKYNVANGFNLELGPQIGFLLSAKTKVDHASYDVTDHYNAVDLSVNLGAEYVFPTGFLLGLRYSHGVSDIIKDDQGTTTNRVILFGLGYRFR